MPASGGRSDLRNFYRARGVPGRRVCETRQLKANLWIHFYHGKIPRSAALFPRTERRVCHRNHHRGGTGDRADSSPYAKSRILRGLCAKRNEAAVRAQRA
jgi:hypothetical protein